AGGLGMLGAALLTSDQLEASLDRLAAATAGAFGVNFLIPYLDPACLGVAARKARVVEFFYGEPDPVLVERAHSHGALVSWQVGSAAEAVAADQAGCDFAVAQGTEAGGHVRGTTRLLPLLSRVLEVTHLPVLAAGGIATARDLAAALAHGAAGVRVGTRFVASAESGAHPVYVQSLLAASASDTCLTEAFSVDWPGAPHRVLRSSIAAAQALPEGIVGQIPVGGQMVPVPRFSVIPPTIGSTGHVNAMALYAGESVENVTSVRPAAAIIADLVAGAERLLRSGTDTPD
ncbi:MAG: NAD(P)H-dependent flavin oxidoreductase, partial [Myxococcota bacterium]